MGRVWLFVVLFSTNEERKWEASKVVFLNIGKLGCILHFSIYLLSIARSYYYQVYVVSPPCTNPKSRKAKRSMSTSVPAKPHRTTVPSLHRGGDRLGDNGRLLTAKVLLELADLERNLDEAAPRTSTSTETGVKPPALPTPPEGLQIRVDDTDPTYASGSLSAVTASSDGRARILNEFPKVPPLFMGGKYLSSMDSPMTAKPESATLPMPPAAPWSQNRLAPATPTRTAANTLPFGPSHSRTKSGTVVPLP